ncbi:MULTISPECIES: ParA family protein [Herbaspirillum]|uniref:ParA family protein n=1 Tax=Herbaspirillum TaxID=963 RepID=UPI0024DEB6F3|nr:ParA family protein [Herbaspirillum aquaticum]
MNAPNVVESEYDAANDAPQQLVHRTTVVAKMMGLSDQVLRRMTEPGGVLADVARADGPVAVRLFTPADIFRLAAHLRTTGKLKGLPHPVTVSIYLPKGGVGKSTLATEMAVLWQLAGLRVLVIDADPQASTTIMFGYEPEATAENMEELHLAEEDLITHTFADLMHFPEFPNSRPPRPLSEVVKKPFGEYGPHLIPADVTLAGLLYQLANANNRDKRIRSWIEKGRNNPTTNLDLSQYDIILYDNAPATSVLSRAALVASDYCISPIRLDSLSAKSMSFIATTLTELNEAELPFPEVIAVPTFFSPNTKRSASVMQGLRDNYGDNAIELKVRQSEALSGAMTKDFPKQRMPLSLQKPKEPVVTDDLSPIAQLLVERFRGGNNV